MVHWIIMAYNLHPTPSNRKKHKNQGTKKNNAKHIWFGVLFHAACPSMSARFYASNLLTKPSPKLATAITEDIGAPSRTAYLANCLLQMVTTTSSN